MGGLNIQLKEKIGGDMSKKISMWLGIPVLAALLLSSCEQSPAATDVPSQPQPTQEVSAPEPSEVASSGESTALMLATTTSTDDSGLLGYLLPMFEEEVGVQVDVIAVGTGQALTLGEDGNADVLLVHSRAREDEFMAAGHGVRREDVMYNDFIILGPESDQPGSRA
jgi:tungstate transport system substrate-binding protein